MEEVMDIPEEMTGIIIGPKGSGIRAIKVKTNTFIHSDKCGYEGGTDKYVAFIRAPKKIIQRQRKKLKLFLLNQRRILHEIGRSKVLALTLLLKKSKN